MKEEFPFPLDLAEKCVKCGICKSVCPTYPFKEEEGAFARGRLALAEMVLRGELPLNEEVVAQWNECAMCRRCEWVCPNDVQYKEVLIKAREIQRQKYRDRLSESALKGLELMHTAPGKTALKIAGALSFPLPSAVKLPLPTGGVKFFPKPSAKAFSLRGKVFRAEGEEKKKLLFFTGCMIDAFYTKTGESVVKVLTRLGYTVVIPKDIKCCGAPHLYHGNEEAFRRLREHNLKVIKSYEFDALVVACPTCGGALEEDYGEDWKVYSFSELLAEEEVSFKGKEGEKVTVHVPCHAYTAMKRSPEIFYKTLEKVQNTRTLKAEKAQSCCGFAGLFSVKNPELSEKIQREKMDDFESTGADYILTECPGCVLQLEDGVRKFRKKQKVKHIADFLAERMGQHIKE